MGRAHVEHLHTPELDPEPLTWPGWPAGAAVKPLSRDEDTGAQTSLLGLPAGYRRPVALAPAESEALVISGSLKVGDVTLPRLSYVYTPARTVQEVWEAAEDSELLFMTRTGPPELEPTSESPGTDGVIVLSADDVVWTPSTMRNGPPNIEIGPLRIVEGTGEKSVLVRETGTNEYPVNEFHSCVQEVFLLDGWLEISNSETEGGMMRPGSYFWRPPFVTHGQSKSSGAAWFMWDDSHLVCHRSDGFDRTAEQNRIQYEREVAVCHDLARIHPET
jgi:hypothetical protein